MSNPALNENILEKYTDNYNELEKASATGVGAKTFLLTLIVATTAIYTYALTIKGFSDKAMMFLVVGMIGGSISVLINIFTKNPKIIPACSIAYAGFEGLLIGSISGIYALSFGSSIVLSAVIGTIGTLFAMLFLYTTGVIKCSEKFRSTIFAATLGITILYLVSYFIPSLSMLLFQSNSLTALAINGAICLVAAFNLILDFDIVERIVNSNANKSFEWYGAFSILVTLVWLYVELLKLFSRISRR